MTRLTKLFLTRSAVSCALVVLAYSVVSAQVVTPLVRKVEAAYVFNFARFVEWPAGGKSLVLGVLGDDALYNTLGSVRGKRVEDRTLDVVRLSEGQDPTGCNILFIGSQARGSIDQVLAKTNGRSILTVGDMPDFVDRGGMVRFFIEGESVKFEVCLARASRTGLKLSSKLLQVARLTECE